MERRVVTCPNCGRGAGEGELLCMNCGGNLPAPTPARIQLPPYRCPRCGTGHPPQIVKRLSTAGWVILVFGLISCVVMLPLTLFFIILTIFFIEEQRVCPICEARVS